MIWDVSLVEYLRMGGWVMVPLVLLTICLSFMIAERFLYYRSLGQRDITPGDLVQRLQRPGDQPPAGTGLCCQLAQRFFAARRLYGTIDAGVVAEVSAPSPR